MNQSIRKGLSTLKPLFGLPFLFEPENRVLNQRIILDSINYLLNVNENG